VKIKPRKVVTFKSSILLKEKLNQQWILLKKTKMHTKL
jgi:hypothetical protein